jgi:RNA polymerase sigma factor (sigma-70 family)
MSDHSRTEPNRQTKREGAGTGEGHVARELAATFVRQRYPRLAAVAARHGVPAGARDDVVQTALVAFIQSYPGERGDVDGAYLYLCRAVQTAAWKHHRTNERRGFDPMPQASGLGGEGEVEPYGRALIDPNASDPAEIAIRREATAERAATVRELSEEERAVLTLGGLGYGLDEIASILGLTRRQVRKRVGRARNRLGIGGTR